MNGKGIGGVLRSSLSWGSWGYGFLEAKPRLQARAFLSSPHGRGLSLWAVAVAKLIILGRKGDRFAWLGLSFFVCYSVYGVKYGKGEEFWPYRDWGYKFLSFMNRPWSFWYTVLYTSLMTIFGLQALKRWGLERKDKFQIWRYVSLISFQWIFFFLDPGIPLSICREISVGRRQACQ